MGYDDRNSNTMLKALIVCSNKRLKDLAIVLSRYFQVFGISFDDLFEWKDRDWVHLSTNDFPGNFDVMLFHTGMNDPDRIPKRIEVLKEFAFNDPGEPVTNRPNVFKILRPFSAAECPITPSVAEEIVNFALGNRTDPPSVCHPSTTAEIIPALCILSQGYLAAHAEKKDNKWGPNDIENALYHMCYPTFMESKDSELLKIDPSSQRAVVSNPKWWLSIFEGNKVEVEDKTARELGVDDIGSYPAIKNLVDAIYGMRSVPQHIVVEAYFAIVEKLRGKPCR